MLAHPKFVAGTATTRFLEENPEVLSAKGEAQNRGEKLLRYLSSLAVNGPDPALGAAPGRPPSYQSPTVPRLPLPRSPAGTGAPPRAPTATLLSVLRKHGPQAFAKAVRENKSTLVCDTTWRDAHQSLLATRVRTRDLLAIAPATAEALAAAYSLECWGGATFDVAMRYLREVRCLDAVVVPPTRCSHAFTHPPPTPTHSARGTVWMHCVRRSPVSRCKCCCAAPTRWATRPTPTT